jgi:hypothetical protein
MRVKPGQENEISFAHKILRTITITSLLLMYIHQYVQQIYTFLMHNKTHNFFDTQQNPTTFLTCTQSVTTDWTSNWKMPLLYNKKYKDV